MNEMVSIIVPVYNTEDRLLEKCIASLIHQTYSNIEIILVDDGSERSTADLCDKFRLSDSRIKVIHKPNGGLSSARNAGLEVASGEFISFVDSDDFLHVDAIYHLINAYHFSKCRIVCMKSIVFDEKSVLYKQGIDSLKYQPISWCDYIKGICQKKLSESVCDKLFDARLLQNYRFDSGRLNEDFFFLSKLLMDKIDIVVIDFNGYNYFKHGGTITGDKTNFKSLKDAIKNSCQLAGYARGHSDEAYIHFVYSALFQSKVLLTNLSSEAIGSVEWLSAIEVIRRHKSEIRKCGLRKLDQFLIYGFLFLPRLTKHLYSIVK